MSRMRVAVLALLTAVVIGVHAADEELVAHGEAVYQRCIGCHSLTVHRTGPKHCGLFGRRAGAVAGYAYSQALVDSGIVWNERSLDRFLAAPLELVPGTTMGFAGVADPRDRRALIEYLQQANREHCDGVGG